MWVVVHGRVGSKKINQIFFAHAPHANDSTPFCKNYPETATWAAKQDAWWMAEDAEGLLWGGSFALQGQLRSEMLHWGWSLWQWERRWWRGWVNVCSDYDRKNKVSHSLFYQILMH